MTNEHKKKRIIEAMEHELEEGETFILLVVPRDAIAGPACLTKVDLISDIPKHSAALIMSSAAVAVAATL